MVETAAATTLIPKPMYATLRPVSATFSALSRICFNSSIFSLSLSSNISGNYIKLS